MKTNNNFKRKWQVIKPGVLSKGIEEDCVLHQLLLRHADKSG